MYKYTLKSLLDKQINYSYSPYEGDKFIGEWFTHRESFSKKLYNHNNSYNICVKKPELPEILINNYLGELKKLKKEDSCKMLLQKYEATKKIYSKYINNKPIKESGFMNIENYVSTANLIESYYNKTKEIQYLNCLLKLCDLFQSDSRFLRYASNIYELIERETNHISELINYTSNLKIKENNYSVESLKRFKKPALIKDLVFLCCNSYRSSIYLQALVNANILPEKIIYMNNSKSALKSKFNRYKKIESYPDWLFIPNEYRHPLDLANKYNIEQLSINTSSVNSKVVHETLKEIDIKLIIYSGFGGEIINKKLINNFNFLHCHPGTLPEYRGSTTFYYEILQKGFPSVSCIILDESIDTGPILAIKSFPAPFKTDNIDTLYEPCIRANLLCDVIYNIGISLDPKSILQTNNKNDLMYYIIHPVLKHISYSNFINKE